MVQFVDNIECVAHREEQEQPHWQPQIVHIRADIMGLDDATIYFGLLRSNPLPHFECLLAESGKSIQSWLAPFGALRIDQIFFVYAWSAVPRVSYRVVERAGMTFGVATPGDDGRRWLTTFPLSRQGRWVAWCVEIDMRYRGRQEGQRGIREIVLCEGNMVVLEER